MSADLRTYDVVGIGIGPFNLGLAALSAPLAELDAVFLDSADGFSWHPGMMIEGATIQVPFLADLVTMADPTSRYSFLSYLKASGRLYPFYIRESFYPLREEYDAYCRWVAEHLDTLRWGRTVVDLEVDGDTYVVRAVRSDTGEEETYRARHVVLGTGTSPVVPPALRDVPGLAVHSSEYLPQRDLLRAARSVTVVGSGQSAAEIYRDLLETVGEQPARLDWVTRSPRFFPMEYTKLTLEMTSPEYTDHFHSLPLETRQRLGREQRSLYKGISAALVDDIYDTLYRKSVRGPVPSTLLTDTEVLGARWDAATEEITLRLRHGQLDEAHEHTTHALVLATGYAARVPDFVLGAREHLAWDDLGRFAVARDYTIDVAEVARDAIGPDARSARGRVFVQNAEEHTHGLTAPDLGFGPWRNSSILATITGREVYPMERRIAFQEFGVPAGVPTGALR
ncbi:SidA/IucD/PvdA family monooxygenase [Sanguibacter sp. 25GB23B1]|uniref:lysine N(6)-hydroxylase/L-ornithine N(5)-oxygenase family protein n=1 Tax=unclassified Sanguibacter TaxID=2645534 RepID=UPI0032AF615F